MSDTPIISDSQSSVLVDAALMLISAAPGVEFKLMRRVSIGAEVIETRLEVRRQDCSSIGPCTEGPVHASETSE